MRESLLIVLLLALVAAPALAAESDAMVDLTKAVLVTNGERAPQAERMAVSMLREEVQKRTHVLWPEVAQAPRDAPVIVVAKRAGSAASDFAARMLGGSSKATGPEGFRIAVLPKDGKGRQADMVFVLGNDERGVLFGVGRLLRELRMRPGEITLPRGFHMQTAPRYPQRGHQLGYRPKANAYDAWDVKRYEQYIRDLAVFGTNDIELIASFAMDDGGTTSPLMPLDPWDMSVALPKVLAQYGLGVWFWLPYNSDANIATEEGVRQSLATREKLFKACARLDGIEVPTGDPGDQPPDIVLSYLEKLAGVLRSTHPNAALWSTSQGFSEEQLADFYRFLREKRPNWLRGIAYGPWTHDTLANTRAMVPPLYAVRQYPDITHTVRCQYPVPGWDDALAWTLNREPINPRPTQEAHIVRLYAPETIGFISYSDGCNDDVNKMIWSAVHWDPDADVRELLVQYGRYFIGPDFAEGVADGLLALEADWAKPLLDNEQIGKTLALWQAMEKRATPEVLANWRFQQGLFRAYYDAYIQQRLIRETALEKEALHQLAQADAFGPDAAIAAARRVLTDTDAEPVAPDLRARVEALAGDLFKSIGMQLSVEKFGASGEERGAVLTSMDAPLNNRYWMEGVFDHVKDKDRAAKLAALERIVHWEDAGPGGFYDDFGNPAREPHLVKAPGWEKDPGFVLSAQDGFGGPVKARLSWRHYAEALYTTPLRAHYEGLDPNALYEIQVVYAGRYNATMVLEAGGVQVHGPVAPTNPPTRMAFAIPHAATAKGVLDLTWTHTTGRGPQVAEVWLIKK